MSEQPPAAGDEPEPYRLDPDRAVAEAGRAARGGAAGGPGDSPFIAPVIDTRPYRWMIGIFGLALVAAFSVYLFTARGIQSTGVPPGQRLHLFVAPLAGSTLNGDANVSPRCDPADPNPQALNVCGRTPIVLGLFVTGSADCNREIDTLQAVSRQFPATEVQFAAVAVAASHAQTATLVRSHHWTIPVAYDRDGAVGALYGVSICPMVELAYRGGVVADQLIGNHWLSSGAVAARVHGLLRAGR